MMYRRLFAVLSLAALGSCGGPGAIGSAEAAVPSAPALASVPAAAVPPDPDALAIIHEDDDGRRSPLLNPRGLPIYDDLGHGIRPTITVERFDALSYDIVLDFDNTTTRPVELGDINVGVITLGPEISWLNLNRSHSFVKQTRREFTGQSRTYPGSFYAPVGLLHNDRYAVGVSLLYDLLQDRHSVDVRITKPGGIYSNGPGGAGYSIGFSLGTPDGERRFEYPAVLAPGEERRYRVAVRAVELDRPVTRNGAQQWLAAIEPYREHFNRLYGGVTYQRDDRPVRGRSISGAADLSPANPLGFKYGRNHRPDLVGWGSVVNNLTRPSGFDRTMLWAAGGLYKNNRQLNFPSRFMSQLVTSAKLNTAFDDQIGLPRLTNNGKQLGLWWGRAALVSRQWDSPNWEPLDLNNPDRVALALHEMRLAHEAGATLIGLDSFTPRNMPAWQQYEWIIELRRRYPDTTFVVEPMTCDVLHTLGPSFMMVWRSGDRSGQPESRFRVHHPHHLADYLIPGHELWGYFRYDGSTAARNAARVQRDAEYIAQTGYVPVLATNIVLTNAARGRAEPTWMRTVPDALKTSAHRTAAPPVFTIPGVSAPPSDNGGGGDDGSNDRSGDNTENGDGTDDGRNDGGNGGGKTNGADDDPQEMDTRPFMLPNGRVIRLPIYRQR